MAGTLPVEEAGIADDRDVGGEAVRGSRASQASRWAEVDSSSPSNTYLRLTGKPPRVARTAAADIRWAWTWPLSSAAPRASIRPSTTTGSNGGDVHRSSGSTGWTS